MENGYSICLNKWALDKEIKNELGLLLIISSLCAKEGYCFASNSFLAEQFNLSEQSISDKIKKLERKNYIEIEYEKRGCEIISRKLRLRKNCIDDKTKIVSTIKQNAKDNNISINNINNKKEIYKENIEKLYFENNKVNDIFLEFLDLRKKIKAVNSDRAINTLINKLNKYDDDTKFMMIEQSIVNSWKDVYELKNKPSKKEDDKVEWF